MTAIEEVRQLEERLRQGDLSPEPDTSSVFEELLADDVLFVQPEGNSIGKAAVVRGHRPPHRRVFERVDLSEVAIREVGSTVAVACRTDYALPGRAFAQRTLRLWTRTGGSWRVSVVALMGVPKGDE